MTLSFRTKLLLAMAPLVAGVAVTALLIMQFYVLDTYKKQFRNLFEYQIGEFIKQRDDRLAPVQQRLAQVAKNARLLASAENAIGPGADQEAINDLYVNVWDRLIEQQILAEHTRWSGRFSLQQRQLIQKQSEQRPELFRPKQFLIILNPQGKILQPSTNLMATLPYYFPAVQPAQLAALAKAAAGTNLIGLLAPRVELGALRIRETIVTPIVDIADSHENKVLGFLVVGFALPDEEDKENFEISQALERAAAAAAAIMPPSSSGPLATIGYPGGILSGIWLDGQLYSATLSVDHKAILAAALAPELTHPHGEEGGFTVALSGVSHLVSWRRMNTGAGFPPAYQICLFSLAPVEQQQRDLLGWIVVVGSLALLAALALSFLISHGLAVPIRELVKGTTEIARGNYEIKVPVRSRDEIGQLGAAFNEMAGGLALKERYRSVLNMVTDKSVADELMSGKIALGGEMREISVLFCDIRGFTAMSQNMPPTEVIEMLNHHMTALTKVVRECNGVVDKFVGDLIMAVFGAPKSTGQDALNAAQCALRMLEERAKLNQNGTHQIEVGIGIATGAAVAGCMGSADRLNYTVLGERVNLASRLCSAAGRMEVVIDQTTRDRLDGLAGLESMPELKLKGFASAVTAYKLHTIKPKSEAT